MYETGWEKFGKTFQSVLNIWAFGAIKKGKRDNESRVLGGSHLFRIPFSFKGCKESHLRCRCHHISVVSERPRLQIEYFRVRLTPLAGVAHNSALETANIYSKFPLEGHLPCFDTGECRRHTSLSIESAAPKSLLSHIVKSNF